MSPRKSDFVLVPSPEFDELLAAVRRPTECCGKCPPIKGGGFDCTCAGNQRCSGPQPSARERDALIWEAGFDYADERRDDIRAREDNPYRGEVVSPTE